MKRTIISLIVSFALVSTGCDDGADVDTVEPDGEPAASGYRGIDEDEPAEDGIVAPGLDEREPYTAPPAGDTSQPTLDEPATQPGDSDVEDEPAVEEVPAQSFPSDVRTPEEQSQGGTGSGS
jgi:hypothetical protein